MSKYIILLISIIIFQLSFAQDSTVIPRKFDLRDQMTPVKNQGERNTCASFALLGVIEYEIKKLTGKEVNLSEEYLNYWNISNSEQHTEFTNVLYLPDILDKFGIVYEEQWPYRDSYFNKAYPCDSLPSNAITAAISCYAHQAPPISVQNQVMKFRNMEFSIFSAPYDINQVINNIYKFKKTYIILLPLDSADWYRDDHQIVIHHFDTENTNNHILIITGYDLDKRVFYLRNSWGEEWGDKGYGSISFDYFDQFAESLCFFQSYPKDFFKLTEEPVVKPFVIDTFSTTLQYNTDKSLSVLVQAKMQNLGFHVVEIRNKFVELSSKEGKEIEEDCLLTKKESKKFKDEYIRKIYLHMPDTIAVEQLEWTAAKPLEIKFGHDILNTKNLKAAMKSKSKKIVLQTRIVFKEDTGSEKFRTKRSIEIDKATFRKNIF